MLSENCYFELSRISGVTVSELKEIHDLRKIVKDVLLPKVARLGGSQNRFSRISDEYMMFVAKYGSEFIFSVSSTEIDVMFELCLQRISKGAILHQPVDLVKILPKEYRMYSAAWDEPGLFSEGCWEFLKAHLAYLFRRFPCDIRTHAYKVVFGIMEHVKEDGTTDMLWNSEVAGVTPLELRKFVEPFATTICSEEDRWKYVSEARNNAAFNWVSKCCRGEVRVRDLTKSLAPVWASNKAFFSRYFKAIDWRDFAKQVDFEKELYYTGNGRKFLKLLGLYENFTLRKIKAEIKAYNNQ